VRFGEGENGDVSSYLLAGLRPTPTKKECKNRQDQRGKKLGSAYADSREIPNGGGFSQGGNERGTVERKKRHGLFLKFKKERGIDLD